MKDPNQADVSDILFLETKKQPAPKHPVKRLETEATGGKSNTQTCQHHKVTVR